MAKLEALGTRFPFINLEKALSRAEQLYLADPRGRPMALAVAFTVWKYSDKSSGGHQTVAALKMYGLIVDSGANADRRVQLTQEALHYFADEREDERRKALCSFALAPKLFAAVWHDWDGSPPADNVARSQLKIDRKLNDQSARSFLSIYKDNIAFADLGKSENVRTFDSGQSVDEVEEEEEEEERELLRVGDLVQWWRGDVEQFREPASVRAISPDGDWLFINDSEMGIPRNEVEIVRRGEAPKNGPARPQAARQPPTLPLPQVGSELKRDVFSLDEGEVTITFPASMSRASYDDFVDWLDLVKRRAARAIKGPEAAN